MENVQSDYTSNLLFLGGEINPKNGTREGDWGRFFLGFGFWNRIKKTSGGGTTLYANDNVLVC